MKEYLEKLVFVDFFGDVLRGIGAARSVRQKEAEPLFEEWSESGTAESPFTVDPHQKIFLSPICLFFCKVIK